MLRCLMRRQMSGSACIHTSKPLRAHQRYVRVKNTDKDKEYVSTGSVEDLLDVSYVSDLLDRDFKQPKLAPELDPANAPDAPSRLAEASSDAAVPVRGRRQKRESLLPKVSATKNAVPYKKCKEALDAGLEAFASKQYSKAVELFSLALELPGNGAYRLSDSPREYSCPSDAEENAALYNMACAYAQLGEKAAAITCLEGVLENGFEDYQTVRTDKDLAVLQPELSALLNKYDSVTAKMARMFSKKDKPQVSETNKPWLLW